MSATTKSARSRLLEAAEELFYARGINATGVDAVIETAGVARMTFYKHFRGKNTLIAAYLEGRDMRWRAKLEETIESAGDDPDTRVLAVFDALRIWYAENGFRGCSFANAAAELADPEHPARAAVAAHKRAMRDRLTELVEATGHARPGYLVDRLLLLFEGAIITETLGTVKDSIEVARATAAMLLSQ